jgi:ribosomal protein S20
MPNIKSAKKRVKIIEKKTLTNKANSNVKSADFQTFIENIVLGRYDDAVNLLLDKNGVFVKSYSSLNEKCEGVLY